MKLVEVRILDAAYSIRTETDGAEILEVAELVNREIDRVRQDAFVGTRTDLAVRAAFAIAGRYLGLKKEHERLTDELSRESASLLDLIDREMDGR